MPSITALSRNLGCCGPPPVDFPPSNTIKMGAGFYGNNSVLIVPLLVSPETNGNEAKDGWVRYSKVRLMIYSVAFNFPHVFPLTGGL